MSKSTYMILKFFRCLEIVQRLDDKCIQFRESFGVFVFGKFVDDPNLIVNLSSQVVSLDNLKNNFFSSFRFNADSEIFELKYF